jgi:hypothetical protein
MAKEEQKGEALYQTWMGRITDALKREKSFRQKGQKVVDLYEAKKPDETPFAIVYSNTEVLVPSVYNSRPIPIVTRRFKDEDPIGKAASEVSTRTLKFLIDTETQDYDSFDELMQPAVVDGLLTNRGLTRFKFVAGNGKLPECVYGETVRWDKFFHGYARTWKKVPWIGFEWDMSEQELRKNFKDTPLELRDMVETDDENSPNSTESREELTGVKTYKVYEVWDKTSRRVYFFSAVFPKGALRDVEDPLELSGFFPVPKPLNFMRKVTTLVPTPLYEHYKSQAHELNEITRRLKAIIKAIKFRGAYNSAVEGIDQILSAEDNTFVPVENVQSMPDGTSMDKLLWTVPINELAATAQSLYQQREQVKQVIYEITGISDILRGASVASETATAQNIKNQWGTLRLKKMQKEVQRYCREALSIMLEIAAAKFEPETFQQMTGLPFLTGEQKMQSQMAIQQAQQQAQMTGQQSPAIPPTVQAQLQQPTWDEIVALLRNDVALHYKTDIETNSTIDAEAAQDKQDISELLNALSQFLNGLGPLVKDGIMPFDIAKNMLLVIARRYNFGTQLEESLQNMAAPQPQSEDKPDPAAEAKSQAEIAKAQLDMQKAQQEAQIAKQEFEQRMALMQAELEIAKAELEIKREELRMQQQALGMKVQAQTIQHQQKLEALRQKALTPAKEPTDAAV